MVGGAPFTEEAETKKAGPLGILATGVLIASIFLPFCSVSMLGSTLSISLIQGTWYRWVPVALVALGGMVYRFETGLESMGTASEYSEFAAALVKTILQKDIGFYALLAGSVGLILAGAIAQNNNS